MDSPGISGEGESRGQPSNPGSPGKMVVKTEFVCALQNNFYSSFSAQHGWARPRYNQKLDIPTPTPTVFTNIQLVALNLLQSRGTGIRGLMRGMATLPKETRSYRWSETKLEDPRWAWGKQIHGVWSFSLQCFDTVGWATGRASGL